MYFSIVLSVLRLLCTLNSEYIWIEFWFIVLFWSAPSKYAAQFGHLHIFIVCLIQKMNDLFLLFLKRHTENSMGKEHNLSKHCKINHFVLTVFLVKVFWKIWYVIMLWSYGLLLQVVTLLPSFTVSNSMNEFDWQLSFVFCACFPCFLSFWLSQETSLLVKYFTSYRWLVTWTVQQKVSAEIT